MKDFKNILIVRTDRIGDVVLTTPSIQALKEKYPQSKISILVSSQTKDLVEGNPYLDEVMVDDRRNIHRGWGGFWKLVKDIRQRRFDAAIVFHTKKRTNGACFLARIPCRVGYKNNKFGFLLTHPLVDTRHKGEKHESQYCLEVLSFLGIESTIREVTIPLKPESEAWADEIFAQQGIAEDDCLIVIHPGASDPSKRWPEHLFSQILPTLVKKHKAKIILVGSSETSPISQKILSLASESIPDHSGILIDLTGQTTVSQLASLLKRCHLFISNDSGPVHLASGVGIPVVSIFTRNQPGINPERWRPLGERSRVLSVPPDLTISCQKAGALDPQKREIITPREVLEAVDSLFNL